MIQKESYRFNTYAAVRVGEIQEATAPSDWYWVDGQKNIATGRRMQRSHKTYQKTVHGNKGQNSFNWMNLSGKSRIRHQRSSCQN